MKNIYTHIGIMNTINQLSFKLLNISNVLPYWKCVNNVKSIKIVKSMKTEKYVR